MKIISQILIAGLLLIPTLLHSAPAPQSNLAATATGLRGPASEAPILDSAIASLNEKKRFGSVYAEIEKRFRERGTNPELVERMMSDLRRARAEKSN